MQIYVGIVWYSTGAEYWPSLINTPEAIPHLHIITSQALPVYTFILNPQMARVYLIWSILQLNTPLFVGSLFLELCLHAASLTHKGTSLANISSPCGCIHCWLSFLLYCTYWVRSTFFLRRGFLSGYKC